MRTKATLLGHPLHPTLVVIPLGALPTALVFDALRIATGDVTWHRAALVATIVGVLGIWAAIVPGLVDGLASVPRRGAAWALVKVHMATGLALGVLFTALLVLRLVADPAAAAFAWSALALSAIGNLGLVAQGWMGGELRTRHRLGVEEARAEPRLSPSRPVDREDAADADGGARVV